MAKAGLELVSPRSNKLSKCTSAPTQPASLESRLLAYLIPESCQSQDFLRAFFDKTIRSTYWASVLEFAVCKGGASWLLSLYWPRLSARLSVVSGASAASGVSEYERESEAASKLVAESSTVAALSVPVLTSAERNILNSRDGILLVLSALDSTEETTKLSVATVVELSKLAGVNHNFYSLSSENPMNYAAAKNRGDVCTFIMQHLGGVEVSFYSNLCPIL